MLSRCLFAALALWIACGTASARTPDEAADACRSLQGSRFENLEGAPTYIVRATWRAATAAGAAAPASPPNAAACVVEGYVNPTVKFGLLLPADGWNGKVMVRGCGGSCGEIFLDGACRYHALNGYACMHSDMGHYSTLVDNVWAANNLQGLVDFGYRATHVSTVAGKAVTEAFYGAKPQRSYFFACSTGGRQGLVEAQRFPEDFDGIVAIAPASISPFGDRRTEAETNPDVVNTGADGRPILPNRKALLIHQAVMQRCDMNDGLRDGLVGDPRQCKFDPAELECKGADTRNCLTAPQVKVVRRYYDEIGAERGSEFNWIGAWLRPAALPGEASKPLPWLARGRGDPALIETLNNANNPDLRAFKRKGGKLLLVQGWDDQSVLPRPTLDYYETMQRTMGGPATTRDFARLFMIPGMDHCSGGKGAYAIDYVKALEDWIERGRAPDALLGVRPLPGAPLEYFSTNLASLDAKWIEFTRLHPAWPESERMTPAKAPHNGLSRTPAPEPLVPLIATQLKDSEAFARASAFPQATVAGHMMRTLWRSFFTRGIGADEAMAALEALPADGLSPTAREVIERMKVELGLD